VEYDGGTGGQRMRRFDALTSIRAVHHGGLPTDAWILASTSAGLCAAAIQSTVAQQMQRSTKSGLWSVSVAPEHHAVAHLLFGILYPV
jgi:hypothetical protein